MKQYTVLTILLLMLIKPISSAQERDTIPTSRLINRAVSYGIGYANVFDTYLSPQEYRGIDIRISRETMKMARNLGPSVSIQNFLQANLSFTHNNIDNNNSMSGMVNWNYGIHYQIHLSSNFKILTGGLIDTNLGFIYNLRNGNNPATAKLFVNLAGSAMAIWHTKIKNYPITLRYQINVPLAGVMFSPNFGQSYYEIFSLGNRRGVVRFVSLHNQPSFRQILSVDLPIRKSKIRISYLCDIQQAKINKITSHYYGHSFMVGVVTEMFKLNSKESKKLPSNLKAY